MKKYIVETYYTCTFKTVHTLDTLDDTELSKIDKRTDGDVEVIDVKLNNRKTKKIGGKKDEKTNNEKLDKSLPKNITDQIQNAKFDNEDNSVNLKTKTMLDSKCQIEEKDIFKRHKLVIIKFIFIPESMTMVKLERSLLIQIKKVNL